VRRTKNIHPTVIPEDDYKAALPALQEFCDRIRTEIGLLLRAEDITLGAPLESRIKSYASVCDKCERSKTSLAALDDIKDLVGVRIILLYRPDIERALEVLRGEFPIDAEEKKGMDEDADGFGYQSVHAIVRLSTPAPDLAPGNEAPPALRAEVQIRTLAQHIWAAASHDLQYKKERAVPTPLRRTIQRVSALLETIDLELERVLAEREEYVADIEMDVGQLVLDIDILRKILCDRMPEAHLDQDERYAKILEALKGAGIDDISGLSALMDRRLEDALGFDAQIISALQKPAAASGGARLADLNPDRIARGVYYCQEGLVRKMLLGTFIDTLIVCSITGLAIIASGAWTSGETGAALTSAAFEGALPGIGGYFVAIALSIFAFTTVLGWSYYCERSLEYLFGTVIIMPFRIVWSIAAFVGATLKLGFVWLLADTLNALMAIPNLIALLLLSPVVFKVTKEFFATKGGTENNPF